MRWWKFSHAGQRKQLRYHAVEHFATALDGPLEHCIADCSLLARRGLKWQFGHQLFVHPLSM